MSRSGDALDLALELAALLDLVPPGRIEAWRAGAADRTQAPDPGAVARVLEVDPGLFSALWTVGERMLTPGQGEDATTMAAVTGTFFDAIRAVRRKERDEPFGAPRDLDAATRPTSRLAHVPQGEPFGRYILVSELGQGGMGVVYRAWDVSLSRTVALKVLRGDVASRPDLRERFQREARSAARLRHPSIVAVHDVGEIDGRLYLTMEHVDGGTLAGRLAENGPLRAVGRSAGFTTLRRDVECFARIAEAVGFAHSEGVVHRDLKPGNILLDREGNPYVSDFGLAKELDQGEHSAALTQTGAILGTPGYMSPEQAEGEGISPASDVFSLGVMLYEIVTGQLPFRGNTAAAIVQAILLEHPVPPRAQHRRLHRDLETICLRCIEKDPARRYPDALALATDLRRHLDGEPILARPISPGRRAIRWARRRPRLTAALFLVAMVLSTGGLVALESRRVYERRLEARREFASLAGDLDAAWGAGNRVREDGLLPRLEESALAVLALEPEAADIHLELARLELRLGRLDEAGRHVGEAIGLLGDGDPRARGIRGRVRLARYLAALDETRRAIDDPALAAEATWRALEARNPPLVDLRESAVVDLEFASTGGADEAERALLAAQIAILREDWPAVRAAAEASLAARVTAEAYWLAGLASLEQVKPIKTSRQSPADLRFVEESIRQLDGAIAVARGFADAWVSRAEARAKRIEYTRHELVLEIDSGLRPHDDLDPLREELDEAIQDAKKAAEYGADPRRVARAIGELGWMGGEVARKTREAREKAGKPVDVPSLLAPYIERLESLDPRHQDHAVLFYLGLLWECRAISGAEAAEDSTKHLRTAIAYHDRALAQSPTFERAYYWRGNAKYELGGAVRGLGGDARPIFVEAIADYDRADQENAWVILYRGSCHYWIGELDRKSGRPAEDSFRAAIVDFELRELDKEGLTERAFSKAFVDAACRRRGADPGRLFESALEDIRLYAERDRAARLSPVEAEAWLYMARADYERSLGLDPRASYEEAAARYEASDGDLLWTLVQEVEALVRLDRVGEAFAALSRRRTCVVQPWSWSEVVDSSPGVTELARRAEAGSVPIEQGVDLAAVYTLLATVAGRDAPRLRDDAFRILGVAVRQGASWSALEADPAFETIRGDERWGR